jgi:hypothetical protein
MFSIRRLAILLGLALLDWSRVGSAQLPSTNPFAAPSPLLYQAPAFDRIRNTDFSVVRRFADKSPVERMRVPRG